MTSHDIMLPNYRNYKHVVSNINHCSNYRNLPDLVEGLGEVLNDRNKIVLYHYICQLLPEETQNEFDRIAAGLLSGGMCMFWF